LQDLEDILSLKGEGYASSEDGCDWKVIRAEPLDGGDAICIGDDLVGQVVRFFAEVVFDGDEETLVFVRRVPGDEEAGASCGDDTDGAATSIEWVLGAAFIEVATDLKAIYSASTESEAEFNLELFAEKWDALYPSISKSWRAHWARVIPLFTFPEDIRKVIYIM